MKKTTKTAATPRQIFQQIAQQHLGVETLENRKSDSLDFHDLAVWSIEAALAAAFEAGKKAQAEAALLAACQAALADYEAHIPTAETVPAILRAAIAAATR